MSGIVATRQAIGAALDAVDGINGYGWPPRAYKPGDAWGQWGGAGLAGDGYATTFTSRFRVIVVLPADQKTADAFADEHLDAIVAALAPLLAITGIDPVSLPADGSQAAYPALIIIGETE